MRTMLHTLLPFALGAASLALTAPTTSPSSLLLLHPTTSLTPPPPPCAQYAATVGARTQTHVYYLDGECAARLAEERREVQAQVGDSNTVEFEWTNVEWDAEEGFSTMDLSGAGELSTLLWLHPVTVDPSLDSPSSTATSPGQLTFAAPASDASFPARVPTLEPAVVASLPGSNEGHLVRLSTSPSVALAQLEYLTSHPLYARWTLVSVPHFSSSSVSATATPTFPEVPKPAVDRVKAHLTGLQFSPAISKVLAGLDEKLSKQRMADDVKVLSGEDQRVLKEEERWVSRHSMSEGAPKAARWLIEKMSSYSFHCTPHSYLPSFSPMLECVYQNGGLGDELLAETGYVRDAKWAAEALRDGGMRFRGNETVILGAHYDSRGSFGYPTAPGADDDASGTALVLAVAREIAHSSLRFSRKIVFALFSGEEQGLLSSSYYSKHLASLKPHPEDVAMMLQVDMVGFRKEGEPLQLARPDLIGLGEAGWLIGNLSEIYVPQLVTGYTPACCSDHQSFVSSAYPASWIFERNGPIADPCYHNSCDLSQRAGYSFEQIRAHAKVVLGWVLEMGGWAYL
ncbi:hypothetical protein JCM6882_007279 [Rhodosporidiobolus microsporus]